MLCRARVESHRYGELASNNSGAEKEMQKILKSHSKGGASAGHGCDGYRVQLLNEGAPLDLRVHLISRPIGGCVDEGGG